MNVKFLLVIYNISVYLGSLILISINEQYENKKFVYYLYQVFYVLFLSYLVMIIQKSTPFSDLVRYEQHFSKNYSNFYQNFYTFINAPVEFGFLSFTFLIHLFTNDPAVYYFLISSIYFYSISRFIIYMTNYMTKTKIYESGFYNAFLIITLYYISFGFYYNLYLLKQTLSISCFLLSLINLYEKKLPSTVVLYLLSLSLHKASIFTLPYLLIIYYKDTINNKYNCIKDLEIGLKIIFIISLFIMPSLISKNRFFRFNYIIFKTVPYLIILSIPRLAYKERNLSFDYFLMLIVLQIRFYIMHRVLWYFQFDIIFATQFSYYINDNKDKKSKFVLCVFIVMQLLLLIRQQKISLIIHY